MSKNKSLERVAPMTKMLHGRRVHICDYHGTCTNKAYKEVYPFLRTRQSKDRGGAIFAANISSRKRDDSRANFPIVRLISSH